MVINLIDATGIEVFLDKMNLTSNLTSMLIVIKQFYIYVISLSFDQYLPFIIKKCDF